MISMSAGRRHTVFAETELKMIEVQLGRDITVQDKEKFELKKSKRAGNRKSRQSVLQ